MKRSTSAGANRYRAVDRRRVAWRAAAWAAAILGLLGPSGCGGSGADLPETYQVTGKILQEDGSPMNGGLVEFQATTGAPVTTNGEIQPDGTFTLTTMIEEKKLPGAVPGTYRVVIIPLMSDQAEQQHAFEPMTVPQTYDVKSDGANEFTIELKKRVSR